MTTYTVADIARARIRVCVTFIIYGMSTGLWVVHIPSVVDRLSLDPKTLAMVLLTGSIGSIISQPFAGWFVALIGSRKGTLYTQPMFLVMVPMLILAPSIPFLFVASFLMGVIGGPLNVAINTQAAEVENARSVPSMSVFHGWFSTGSMAIAGFGSVMFSYGYTQGYAATVLAAIMIAVSIWSNLGLLRALAPTETGKRRFALPTKAVAVIAILLFFGNSIEGAAVSWSGLFLTTVKGASESAAAQGFAFYMFSMALMRFAGGSIVEKIGERKMLMIGGVLITLGFAVAIASPVIIVSALGFMLVGLGAANTYPILIGVSSRIPGVPPSVGVASVALAGMLGFLSGQPYIGFMSQYFGLSVGLGSLSLCGLIVAAGAMMYTFPKVAKGST